MRPRFLNKDEFAQVVRNTPLVSIDLITRDPDQYVLVGLRTNEPAKGKWFVPGGVVRKYERLADAFARIVKAEIGTADYFVVVTRKGQRRLWQWQIQRRPPTGLRLYRSGYKSEFAARLAGEKTLRALVSQMRRPQAAIRPSAAKPLTKHEARRIVVNIAKLPELLDMTEWATHLSWGLRGEPE